MSHAGDDIVANNANWSFGGDVSKKFDSHISKSVPLYAEGHDLVCKISDFFVSDGSICYELGCSTAQLTSMLAKRHQNKKARFIGLDCEAGMIEQGKEKCADLPSVSLQLTDLIDADLEKSDLIVSYYTVQFVKPKGRQSLIDNIYKALNWGGAFVWFEKVRAPDARFQDIMTSVYMDYKLDRGYTSDEIISKARSLKGVLEPFSTAGNIDLLKRAGFLDVMSIMKYVSFEGFLAIK
jgi:tRNA (cmo5U34)-methyltransferase